MTQHEALNALHAGEKVRYNGALYIITAVMERCKVTYTPWPECRAQASRDIYNAAELIAASGKGMSTVICRIEDIRKDTEADI